MDARTLRSSGLTGHELDRRTLIKGSVGVAWAVPVVTVGLPAPALAASPGCPPTPPQEVSVEWTFECREVGGGNTALVVLGASVDPLEFTCACGDTAEITNVAINPAVPSFPTSGGNDVLVQFSVDFTVTCDTTSISCSANVTRTTNCDEEGENPFTTTAPLQCQVPAA